MTIFLVRHANAGRRTAGLSDRERPLDDVGVVQAGDIADVLAHAEIDQVLSSPALRCRQTVEPLAAKLSLDVETSADLWEGQSGVTALGLAERLAGAGVTAVLCSHGDIIPGILDLLAARGVPLDGRGCAKGSIWTLHIADGVIASASYRPAR